MNQKRPSCESESLYDELLLLRLQGGEIEAMDELVVRWHGRLFRHVRRMLDSNDEAEEVMQESWLAVIHGLRKLDDPRSFPPWVYRIASNKAVDFVRKKSRSRTVSLERPERIIDRAADRDENRDELSRLLSKLSVEHRAVVSLRYGEDMSLEEIAETLRIALGTVKSRLHYALESLREQNQ